MESAPAVSFQLGGITIAPNHLNIYPNANDGAGKIADIMEEQFGLKLKEQTSMLCNTSVSR
jgi:hypothetical protein